MDDKDVFVAGGKVMCCEKREFSRREKSSGWKVEGSGVGREQRKAEAVKRLAVSR